MTVRSLDLLDLPFLPRYRQEILPLYSAGLLTRGDPLGATALLSYLNPKRNLYTALAKEHEDTLMGQLILNEGDTSARLTFLAPETKINGLTLELLDHLSKQAGKWGALHLLAEVQEESPAFKVFRQAGFAMYAWQRVWKLPRFTGEIEKTSWREVRETDWLAVQLLHSQIIPVLLQPVETLPDNVPGLACYGENGLQAYVSSMSGPQGVWLLPLVPPDSSCFPAKMHELARNFGDGNKRAVYVCVRSYQAWLETGLEEMGAEAGPRQAVMVKRLVKPVKEVQPAPAMEKTLAKVKPAAPVSQATISNEAKNSRI